MTAAESADPFVQGAIAHRAGRFEEARQQYDVALTDRPDHVSALHLLGLLEHQRGRFEEAIRFFDLVLFVAPDHVGALNSRGIALAAINRHGEALHCYDQALTLAPGHIEAINNRGIASVAVGRPFDALCCFDKALALTPGDAVAHYNRGKVLVALDRLAEALESYDFALTLAPSFAEALNNRGLILVSLDRSIEAVESYDRVVAVQPDHVDAHNNRGIALQALFCSREALASFESALSISPGDAKLWYNRANALRDLGDDADAVESCERGFALTNADAGALNQRGNALRTLHRYDGALGSYDRAIVLAPDYADAMHNRADLLWELGRLDEAREGFRRAISIAPRRIEFHYSLVEMTRTAPDDPMLATLERMAARVEEMTAAEQCKRHFALAKAYADVGEYERSFDHLLAGNKLRRGQLKYDETMVLDFGRRVAAGFTPELMSCKSGLGFSSTLPVFIIGMPRSGTTLVEQILASHEGVFGAGELPDLGRFVGKAGDGVGIAFPEIMSQIGGAELWRIGLEYVSKLETLAPQAKRVVDKLMSNFYFVGLIRLVLPNARIIHMCRDPIDTCLSCFAKNFSAGQLFSFDLGELGRYYRAYLELMSHWRAVLPAGAMLDVRYEDVVSDVEGQARRIVDYCGLEWSEACLEFHRTVRPVRTASAVQVRQPIYRSSVGRWRPPEELLRPLIDGLGRGFEARAIDHR